jgi:hypothetical protein
MCAKKADPKQMRGVQRRNRLPLPPQLLVHDTDVFEPKIVPISNDPKALRKPRGGCWTSTYDPNYGSAWVRWCVAFRYDEPLHLHWTVVSPARSARVAVIDSAAKSAMLINRYPPMLGGGRGLDFERLSKEYDAVHLTHEGYLRTRSRRSGPALLGWDCESTRWFRWGFPRVMRSNRISKMWIGSMTCGQRCRAGAQKITLAISHQRRRHQRRFTKRCCERRLLP